MLNDLLCADIRMAVLDGNSAKIRALLLTADQIELIEHVREQGTLRASLYSYLNGITIQNASAKLNRLYRGGYLDRVETSAPSGGIEYYYTAVEFCA